MSSHREAPSISKDPVADNTDIYAFRHAGRHRHPDHQLPPGADPGGRTELLRVRRRRRLQIKIDNNGNGQPNVTYQFRFKTVITTPTRSSTTPGRSTRSTVPRFINSAAEVFRVIKEDATAVVESRSASICAAPPCNIGPRSTPNYETLAAAAVRTLLDADEGVRGAKGRSLFVDLGSVFDLGTLRPVESLHLIPTANVAGIDSLKTSNVTRSRSRCRSRR